ncbi:MAG: flagellar M-ring protein FliF [Desulfobacterium sp.]|nr:flagellar M-ring protein FliF [Desulfobacterium sp.]MBU3950073.1 flagellar M-ring protein FliF [Pseudomonadota bacterium]
MNDSLVQFTNFINSLPLAKKITIAITVLLLIAAFAVMFMLSNQVDYRVLFNNLSAQDAGSIIEKLKEKNIPYKIEGGGSLILVPSEQVYELRLKMVGDGLLRDGQIGFEIFDKTDYKTTQFVQNLNYQRALQGELARTINCFNEVKSSKVFIVLPKETLFVEDSKPASASVLLDLKSNLPPERLTAIVHLVSSAVEGLEPEEVTVVDTKGRVIFKGGNSSQTSASLNNSQLDYKTKIESEISRNVQSMLEGIIGSGNAIVRVTADIDFNKINMNEEEYDPAAAVVRSKRDIEESFRSGNASQDSAPSIINQRAGVIPAETIDQNGRKKKDTLTNYEINKITRTISKPAGTIKRLSVAAVIDGRYEIAKSADGTEKRNYIPRTNEELRKFEDIVKGAMGYNEDREDRISVSSIPFSETLASEIQTESQSFDFIMFLKDYKNILINLFLIVAVFFVLVKPLINTLKNMPKEPLVNIKELPSNVQSNLQLPGVNTKGQIEKAMEISKSNPERTEQLIRGWVSE